MKYTLDLLLLMYGLFKEATATYVHCTAYTIIVPWAAAITGSCSPNSYMK